MFIIHSVYLYKIFIVVYILIFVNICMFVAYLLPLGGGYYYYEVNR